MSKDCKIVEDLLPNYMEHLTNDETNNFIEEHLSNCKNCEKTFNSMKENIDSKKIEETKDIDFLKKFSRRFKIVRGILVIILLIFVVIIGRSRRFRNRIPVIRGGPAVFLTGNIHPRIEQMGIRQNFTVE